MFGIDKNIKRDAVFYSLYSWINRVIIPEMVSFFVFAIFFSFSSSMGWMVMVILLCVAMVLSGVSNVYYFNVVNAYYNTYF
jgi:hypothetical protein